MLNACVLTIVRDGDEYLGPVIDAVAPFVKSVRITVDSRTKDKTREIVEALANKHSNIKHKNYLVTNPLADLVDMRNDQMNFEEDWGFIVDADELHYDIDKYTLGKELSYAFQCHAPWNETEAHGASGKARIGRIFRNMYGYKWKGRFGHEVLYRTNKPAFNKDTKLLPYRYLHLTHLKKDVWRKEMGQERVADGRKLYKLPDNLIKIIKQLHEAK